MKRVLALVLSLLLFVSAFYVPATAFARSNSNSVSAQTGSKRKVTKKQRIKYFKTAAFIGNSVGLGQKYYFNRVGKKYVGSPKMLVRGCYSFYNDKHSCKKWMIHYKGKPMKAKYAVKAAKVDKVFINMGTNDFFYGADRVFKDYKDYIKGIKKVNPNVIIFIESSTGVTASHQGRCLNSRNIAKLNKLMKAYCKKNKDMYYIDVSSKMLTGKGHLKNKYASDNYCHLTDSAYAIWTKELIKYTDKLMLKEEDAKKAVKTAESTKKQADIDKAKTYVEKLDDSTVKDKLTKRLNAIVPTE